MLVLIFVSMLAHPVLVAMYLSVVSMMLVVMIVIRMIVFVRMLDAISMRVHMLVQCVLLFVVIGVHDDPLRQERSGTHVR